MRRLQRTPDVLMHFISRESSLLPLEMHLTAFDVPQSGCRGREVWLLWRSESIQRVIPIVVPIVPVGLPLVSTIT